MSAATATFDLETETVLYVTPAPRVRIVAPTLELARRRGWTWLQRAASAVPYDAFHGLLADARGYLMVWRRFNLWSGRWPGTAIVAQSLDEGLAPRGRPRFLARGEDPRIFRFRGRPFVYGVTLRPDDTDLSAFLYDVEARHKIPLLIEGGSYLGKNWTPFVHEDAVHFLYTLEPLRCLRCDVESGRCTWVLDEHPEERARMRWGSARGFGRRRGGTPGLPVGGGRYLGFGHYTHSGHHHQAFAWLLDMVSRSIRFIDVETPNPEGLVDPTSWHVRGGDVRVTVTLAERNWAAPLQIESQVARVRGGLTALSRAVDCTLCPG